MTINNLKEEIQTILTLKNIVQSYAEISSIKLKKIRAQTEKSKVFFQDLSNIFALIRYLAKKKNPTNQNLITARTVVILISSNLRFYGRVSMATCKLFLSYMLKNPSDPDKIRTDAVVIGKIGQEFLKSNGYLANFTKLTFKKDMPDTTEMAQLVNLIRNYDRILIVSSEFETIITQNAVIKDLTQTQVDALATNKFKKIDYTFILEPEVNKMMEFFDSQIKNVLLWAAFLEAELARVASRLITMDQAQNNAKDLLKNQTTQLLFAKRAMFNKKTLETWATLRSEV